MLHANQVEELICMASKLDRDGLVEQFSNYRASFPLDFSQEFLSDQPVERLRHIFVALCLQSQRMPDDATQQAA